MKRLFVGYLFLIAATVAACITVRAGYAILAILVMAVYATILIWSSYRDQVKRHLFDAVTYHHIKGLVKDNQRLGEALIVVTADTPWMSASLKTEQGEVYTIDLPNQDRLVLYRRTTEEDEKEG